MDCPYQKRNNQRCPCPEKTCENHGVCCECTAYHRRDKSKTWCMK